MWPIVVELLYVLAYTFALAIGVAANAYLFGLEPLPIATLTDQQYQKYSPKPLCLM